LKSENLLMVHVSATGRELILKVINARLSKI
jgi:hypothetical protein